MKVICGSAHKCGVECNCCVIHTTKEHKCRDIPLDDPCNDYPKARPCVSIKSKRGKKVLRKLKAQG